MTQAPEDYCRFDDYQVERPGNFERFIHLGDLIAWIEKVAMKSRERQAAGEAITGERVFKAILRELNATMIAPRDTDILK